MDFYLVVKRSSDLRLSEGSTTVVVTLAGGRVCHQLSADVRCVFPMVGMHRSRLSGCDVPSDSVGELDSDMHDLARLVEVSDRP